MDNEELSIDSDYTMRNLEMIYNIYNEELRNDIVKTMKNFEIILITQ